MVHTNARAIAGVEEKQIFVFILKINIRTLVTFAKIMD